MTRFRSSQLLLVFITAPLAATTSIEEIRELRTHRDHTGWVGAVAFRPDSKALATGSADRTAVVREVATGRTITVCKGHMDYVSAVAFSPDGVMLATGSF